MHVFVVPAFNEEANLPRLLADLEARPELWAGGHVIVVDDGSTDDTAARRRRLRRARCRWCSSASAATRARAARSTAASARRSSSAGDDDLIVTLEADTTSDLDAVGPMLAARPRGRRRRAGLACTTAASS